MTRFPKISETLLLVPRHLFWNIGEQMPFLCVLSTLEVLRMYSEHTVKKISYHFISYWATIGELSFKKHRFLSRWKMQFLLIITLNNNRCFPFQFNWSIRDTNSYFDETQMFLFDRNNETRILFGPKKKFSDIYRQFRFWGKNLFFQLFARTCFSIVYNFVKNWLILTIFHFWMFVIIWTTKHSYKQLLVDCY